jgi:lysozyme family protein
MNSNWSRAGGLLLVSEGSEVNIGGSEPGGASHYGVSVAALTDLRRSRGLGPATVNMVAALTEAEALDFYHNVTARACRFADLLPGIDYAMLDATANLGPSGIAWLAQCVLGIWPQGNAVTDEMVQRLNARADVAVYSITSAWLAKKRESSGWPKSGHGWTNRMVRVRRDALSMIEEK